MIFFVQNLVILNIYFTHNIFGNFILKRQEEQIKATTSLPYIFNNSRFHDSIAEVVFMLTIYNNKI